jgi:hypothetical protein
MMKHIKALLIKFVGISLVLFSLYGIYSGEASLGEILTMSIFTTVLAYVIGDLFVLPKMGMVAAAIGDFGLAFILLWAMSSFWVGVTFNVILTSFFAALGITVVEGLFHIYMKSVVFRNQDNGQNFGINRSDFATEFSEEPLPSILKKDKR